MSRTVLVAGARGALGRRVVAHLAERGVRVRALVRGDGGGLPADVGVHRGDALVAGSLRGACDGVDAVVSCVGASVLPGLKGWAPYSRVDLPANANLVECAVQAGVRRFVYLSTHHTPAMAGLDYVRAHEAVVDRLRASGLSWAVLRPTGYFSALALYVQMAAKGAVPVFGDGSARSNPVHDDDLAAACCDALDGGPAERTVGGPEVVSRLQMAELAFAAVGSPPRIRTAPLAAARVGSVLLRPFHPRMAHLMAFIGAISSQDVIADAVGTRTLGAFFREEAARLAGARLPA